MENPAFPLTLVDRAAVRHFRKRLPKPARASFDRSFAAVMEAERPFATDPTTQGHLVIGASVVSAHRAWISEGLAPATAKARTGEAMATLWKRTFRWMMRATALFSNDMFESVRRYTKERGANAFGPSFDIAYIETDNGFVSEVRTCGYRAFLRRHGALDLLDLFCEWDRIWIDALPKSIGFHRPPTQAQGGATCRFEFRRD